MSVKGNAKSYVKLRGSLSLPDAIHGKSAYEIAVMNGYKGTEEEWLESLKHGTDGLTPYVGANGNWWVGTRDTGVKASGGEHTHEAEDITSGILSVERGGTGGGSASTARTKLGVYGKEEVDTKITSLNAAMSKKAPAYTLSSVDLEAGVSPLASGTLYFVYEANIPVTFTIIGKEYTVDSGKTWGELKYENDAIEDTENPFYETVYIVDGYVCSQMSDCVISNGNYVQPNMVIKAVDYYDSGTLPSEIEPPETDGGDTDTITFTIEYLDGSNFETFTVPTGTTWETAIADGYLPDYRINENNHVENSNGFVMDTSYNQIKADLPIEATYYVLG